ncbi:sporulation protein YabP [Murimonas intestini]|uniref:Sporulation protein YabP n=1 Tax=Murimonas intestini TaxID=1337051 RepID=A0AB73T360_9FIRM|nr:sporulation protein YabP [Murimonas intestini]MCR1841455.1 sporulation protein YabP [Murimonas intestini]MCR1866961.1 sporulation protein YabP [Murimonas intestini]MCR1883984.1 sporulation protein YabP [Murimonas intestini]
MEEKQTQGAHKVTITGRRNGTISGVADVLSFDVNEVVLETEQGMLMVKGTELHVSRLNLEKGEVDLDGNIDSLTYSDGRGGRRQGESLIGRLFK